jgi:hypothetical protein
MNYGIVLTLDPATTQEAIAISQRYQVQAENQSLVLGNRTNVPHISMIHVSLDQQGLQQVSVALLATVDTFRQTMDGRSLEGTFSELKTPGPASTWLFWNTARTPEMNALHDLAVRGFAPLRNRDIDITWPMNPAQQLMHQQYGYPSVMQCFNPHVTIGILRKEFAGCDAGPQSWPWKADGLAIAEVAHGTGAVTRIIEKVSL